MNIIFTYLLPSVIGLEIFNKIKKEKQLLKEIIINYLTLVFLSNYIVSLFIVLINKFEWNLIEYTTNNLSAAIKYITLSLIVNVVLVLIKEFVKIKIEVKYEEK